MQSRSIANLVPKRYSFIPNSFILLQFFTEQFCSEQFYCEASSISLQLYYTSVLLREYDAWQVCLKLKENGLLAKNTHGDIIRFAPPLCINKEQVEQAADIIIKTVTEFAKQH
uniref:Ornithine aminotransferase n=1 Tax=Caenorhabditis japonica TaxID=281687 RepID=A0A8R1I385_CAEJA